MVDFKKSSRLGESDMLGSAAQELAVESFRNIANVKIGRDRGRGNFGGGRIEPASSQPDNELAAVVDLLRGSGALAVAGVADRLHWSSDKTANALVRGGKAGVLRFSKDGNNTTVALTEN